MSDTERESDLSRSSQSDDSEINFIRDYEITEYADVAPLSDEETEGASGLAYADEPLADKAWLENYNEAERERIQAEEEYIRRFEGLADIAEW